MVEGRLDDVSYQPHLNELLFGSTAAETISSGNYQCQDNLSFGVHRFLGLEKDFAFT